MQEFSGRHMAESRPVYSHKIHRFQPRRYIALSNRRSYIYRNWKPLRKEPRISRQTLSDSTRKRLLLQLREYVLEIRSILTPWNEMASTDMATFCGCRLPYELRRFGLFVDSHEISDFVLQTSMPITVAQPNHFCEPCLSCNSLGQGNMDARSRSYEA